MTFKRTEFRDSYIAEGNATSGANTYCHNLSVIDQGMALGLDETIARDGIEKVLDWAQNNNQSPFDTYPNNKRTALRKYCKFIIDKGAPPEALEIQDEAEPSEKAGLAFRIEKEMQANVRKQLANIEAGLVAVDNGIEYSTEVGRVDILAKDAKGDLVVIELKAGACPSGAMEQVLGYAQAIADEKGTKTRSLLIASEFSDRMRAAAKRVPDLKLMTYEFSLNFKAVL